MSRFVVDLGNLTLADAHTGTHLWADRFDGSLEDVFDLQDQVTTSVVAAIAPAIAQAKMERAKRKLAGNLDAVAAMGGVHSETLDLGPCSHNQRIAKSRCEEALL